MKTPFELIAEHDSAKRYAKDAAGHEHAADGKFTGSGAATKKAHRDTHNMESANTDAQKHADSAKSHAETGNHSEAAISHHAAADSHQKESERQMGEGGSLFDAITHGNAAQSHREAALAHTDPDAYKELMSHKSRSDGK